MEQPTLTACDGPWSNSCLGRRQFTALMALAALGGPLRSVGQSNDAGDDVEWLKDLQIPPAIQKTDLPKLTSLLEPREGTRITTVADWLPERRRLRDAWLEFLGPMPTERPKIELETIREDHPEGCVRRLVRYVGEPGIAVEGYLLIPDDDIPGGDSKGRRAGLVALHPTTNDTIHEIAGVKGPEAHHLGLRLARRGFVVFCPLCFLWHDARDIRDAVAKFHARRPTTKGMHKMLYDAQRGVDALESLDSLVDPRRIGALGHSLGAKETLYLAAFDDRIRASVFSEGGIGFPSTNWHDPWYLGPAIRDERFPLNHLQLLALIAPRPFLILGGESGPGAADGDRSWPYIESALPVYELYGSPARIGLLNHHEGHSISDASFARITEWLTTYLK